MGGTHSQVNAQQEGAPSLPDQGSTQYKVGERARGLSSSWAAETEGELGLDLNVLRDHSVTGKGLGCG